MYEGCRDNLWWMYRWRVRKVNDEYDWDDDDDDNNSYDDVEKSHSYIASSLLLSSSLLFISPPLTTYLPAVQYKAIGKLFGLVASFITSIISAPEVSTTSSFSKARPPVLILSRNILNSCDIKRIKIWIIVMVTIA